jgi:hypothetical protein
MEIVRDYGSIFLFYRFSAAFRRNYRRLATSVAICCIVVGTAGAAQGATLTVYGASTAGSLYTITDFVNWTPVLVAAFNGSAGTVVMTDIAIGSVRNPIYGIDFHSPTSELYSINPNTAAYTVIGATGIANLNSLVLSAGNVLYAGDSVNGNIYTINTSTGAATLLHTNAGFTSAGDLEFAAGSLYLTAVVGARNYLYNVNPNTGVAAPVNAANSICTGAGNTGTCYTQVYGLAYVNGVMEGFTAGGTPLVLTINLTTGLVTGATHAYAPAFNGTATFNSPEPGVLGTCGLGLVLMVFALSWRRVQGRVFPRQN